MIIAGMILLAVMFAAVRRGKLFSEISNFQGVRGLIFVN